MMLPKGPTRMGHILDSYSDTPALKKILNVFSIHKAWQRTVGPDIAKRAKPLKLSAKTLYITVNTSAWMEELKYLKKDIIKKINNELKEELVRDIIFRIGKVAETPNQAIKALNPRCSHQLSKKEREGIEKLVSPIKDAELREIVKRIMTHKHGM